MDVKSLLASSLQHRDQAPNIELAKLIVKKDDKEAVKSLVKFLSTEKKAVRFDSIKVLYEIGELQASLIAPYFNDFLRELNSKDNRVQWGAMASISTIAKLKSQEIFEALPALVKSMDEGSVITRDKGMEILSELLKIKEYEEECFYLINEQVLKSPGNQVPMYAENVVKLVPEKFRRTFAQSLETRLDDFKTESKRNRVVKIIQKLT